MLFCNSVKISSTIFLYVIQQSPQSIKSIINCGATYFYCLVKCFFMLKLTTLSAHPRGAFLISRNELSHVSMTRSFLDIKKSHTVKSRVAALEHFYINTYFNFQISLLYSAIVLSDEKNPAFAIFTSIIFFHLASSL